MNRALPIDNIEYTATPSQLLDVLTAAVSIRTLTIPQTHTYTSSVIELPPRIAVLFSGGLDCSVLAWLIHTLLPPNEPIDLINVAFENPRTIAAQKTKIEDIYRVCPDRLTGLAGWEELCRLSQSTARNWRFVEVISSKNRLSDLD
jgi:asparagine synthetase B (glutamine-hydrolysing)